MSLQKSSAVACLYSARLRKYKTFKRLIGLEPAINQLQDNTTEVRIRTRDLSV